MNCFVVTLYLAFLSYCMSKAELRGGERHYFIPSSSNVLDDEPFVQYGLEVFALISLRGTAFGFWDNLNKPGSKRLWKFI